MLGNFLPLNPSLEVLVSRKVTAKVLNSFMNNSTKHSISCQSVDVLESGRGRGITGGPRILVTTELGAKY